MGEFVRQPRDLAIDRSEFEQPEIVGIVREPRSETRQPKPVGFGAIRVVVHIDADASAEAIRALVAHAVLWSPIANTLHDPVHLDVSLESVA